MILLNEQFYLTIVQWENERNRWKLNDIFKNERNHFFNDWKKTNAFHDERWWTNEMKKKPNALEAQKSHAMKSWDNFKILKISKTKHSVSVSIPWLNKGVDCCLWYSIRVYVCVECKPLWGCSVSPPLLLSPSLCREYLSVLLVRDPCSEVVLYSPLSLSLQIYNPVYQTVLG